MDEPAIQIRNSVTDQWMSDHGFTDAARRFIHDARSRAGDRGIYGTLPPILILWAMLRWERKVGVLAIEKCGVDLSQLEHDTEFELESLPSVTWRDGIDLDHVKAAAKRAVEEAAQLGHNYVGSEHLVLALTRDASDSVRRIFQKHGLSTEKYAEAVRSVLG